MIRRFFIAALMLILIRSSHGEGASAFQDSIANYFDEIITETGKHQQLWSKDLYGPILLVNPGTRELYANFPDTAGILKQTDKIYSGILPNEINIANTAINWKGRRWAMIMLPLPPGKEERINLLAHELFHVSQPSLGFELFNPENNHLDRKDGRTYLRLELEALKKAANSVNETEMKTHLTNALVFRQYRYSLYPGADMSENLLELNEGLAEYTGLIVSGRNMQETAKHFEESINNFLKNPTFVRTFAYHTTPVYGYLLKNIKEDWNKEITIKTNMTLYFIEKFNITIPYNLKETSGNIFNLYNGEKIILEENKREESTKALLAEYKKRFITQPQLELRFEKMNISFDPGNIIPLEDKGTVYQIIRVTDNWGILTVENGALMSPNWDKISVTVPLISENNVVKGDGWVLELNEGYSVIKDEGSGGYKVVKTKATR
jgi:hypothetical protein